MNTRKRWVGIVLLGALLAIGGTLTGAAAGALSPSEADALARALDDEYHAWAVYDQVVQDFGAVRPFANIRAAEARHIEALLSLFGAYGLAVPENEWVGQVPRAGSLPAACAAGVAAEIANRDLYDTLLTSTGREDILVVYRALQRASEENHLPAFERCAAR